MKIVLIGTGNVATVLGRKLLQAGHEIVQVFGRRPPEAAELAELLGASPVSAFSELYRDAELYLLAVSDAAIAKVAPGLALTNQPLAHTAGAVSKEVLQGASSLYGVLYPLQSLRKEITELPTEIPFLVDGNNERMTALVSDLAQSLSGRVQIAGDEERLKLHVGAVVVSNFTNHLYTLAHQYCREEKINFNLLVPLITEVALRLEQWSPHELQTGPAIRHDQPTIEKHLELLKEYPTLRELYRLFTQSIMKMYP